MEKNILDSKTFRAWNEEMSKRHDIDYYYTHSNRLIKYIEHKRLSLIFKYLDAKQNEKIIEVGCGGGNILDAINYGNAFGIDLSECFISKARNRLKDKARLVQADAEKIPFLDSCFDKVICSEVLEHTLNPFQVVREIARITKTNGVVIITIPNERLINVLKMLMNKLKLTDLIIGKNENGVLENEDNQWHLHAFDLKQFIRELKQLFSVQRISGVPHFFLPLRYVIKCRMKDKDE